MKTYNKTDYQYHKIYVPNWVPLNYYDKLYFEKDNPTIYYVCNRYGGANLECNDNQYFSCLRFDSTNHYIYQSQTLCIEDINNLVYTYSQNLTKDIFYRSDIADILIVVAILSIILLFIPYKIISKIFGKWLKV